MQMMLPRIPMGFILFLKKKTERMTIVTCFTFPTTFIISGPPCFTALKLATFKKKANMPWRSSRRMLFMGALEMEGRTKGYLGSQLFQKGESL